MRKRFLQSITRGAALVLLMSLLAGCGGQGSTTASSGSGGTQAITVTVAALTPAPPTSTVEENSPAPTSAATGSAGNGASDAGLDLAAFDVCSLLSKDEVVGLMPDAEYDGFLSDFDPTSGTKTCTLADTEGAGYLQLTVYTPNRWADEASRTGPNPERVPDLGDEAVTETLKYAQVLAVLVRDRAAFLLTVNPAYTTDGVYDAGHAREIAMQLARIIIPRLR